MMRTLRFDDGLKSSRLVVRDFILFHFCHKNICEQGLIKELLILYYMFVFYYAFFVHVQFPSPGGKKKKKNKNEKKKL